MKVVVKYFSNLLIKNLFIKKKDSCWPYGNIRKLVIWFQRKYIFRKVTKSQNRYQFTSRFFKLTQEKLFNKNTIR